MLGVQLTVSSAHVLIEQVAPVENDPDSYYRQKPKGGFWTSTYREDAESSAWVEWCRSEEFGDVDNRNWFLLTPRADIRVYTIDSLQDFNTCLKRYGLVPPVAAIHPMFSHKRIIDFEKLAQEFDCIHLTERGNAQTHLSLPHDLNAWDCESTLWFRWCFTEVKILESKQAVLYR